MIDNPVFVQLKVGNAERRDRLRASKNPKEKLNIFSLIRELIGKDLSKFSVPVFLNEPLSMLQRLGDGLEYFNLLEKANNTGDSCLRLCYIGAFMCGQYASNISRMKKPFNPLLGETYELVHPRFRLVSE
jgi:hypothetical protein